MYKMSLKRLFWRILYPFCIIANKFGLSYKWVNVATGAWKCRENSFDILYHYEWYDDPIDSIPDTVNLNGILYKVTVSEGLIQFVNKDIGYNKLCFSRDPYEKYPSLWNFEGIGKNINAKHIITAYKWVNAVYGDCHNVKRKPISK